MLLLLFYGYFIACWIIHYRLDTNESFAVTPYVIFAINKIPCSFLLIDFIYQRFKEIY